MDTSQIVHWVIENFEGFKYTDDPVDTGGATKFGITQRTLQFYRRQLTGDPTLVVTKNDVRNLTIDEAVACGVQLFAVEPRIAEIGDWRLRLLVFDYGFHSGQPRAIKALQAAVGTAQDGVLGPITLAATSQQHGVTDDRDMLLLALTVLTSREEFMIDIMERQQTQRRFMLGWWKRTTKLQRLVLRQA